MGGEVGIGFISDETEFVCQKGSFWLPGVCQKGARGGFENLKDRRALYSAAFQRIPELFEGGGLDLADPLAGLIESASNLLKCKRGFLRVYGESESYDLSFFAREDPHQALNKRDDG